MSLFTRQWGGQRVLPSQDSEDTQQQFIVMLTHVQLKSFYCLSTCDITYVHEKMYQALSCFTVLQVTGSWVRAWERGYHSTKLPLREAHMHCLNLSGIHASTYGAHLLEIEHFSIAYFDHVAVFAVL